MPADPPIAPRRLNLGLGAVLLAVWLLATVLVIALRLPWLAEKLALGLCAGIWAVHVARVVFLAPRR